MDKSTINTIINTLLSLCFIIAIIVHFWPLAYWNTTTLILLRIISAVSIQTLFCRLNSTKWLKLIPIGFTSLFAVWCTHLYITSPAWHSTTLSDLLLKHISPAIGCIIVCILHFLFRKIKKS